jgi:hypothetical protein
MTLIWISAVIAVILVVFSLLYQTGIINKKQLPEVSAVPTKKFSWGWIVVVLIVALVGGLFYHPTKTPTTPSSEKLHSSMTDVPKDVPYVFSKGDELNTLKFTPNKWNPSDEGFQLLAVLEPGEWEIQAFGGYSQRHKSGKFSFIPVEGKKLNLPKEYLRTLPFPEENFGVVFVRLGKWDPEDPEKTTELFILGEKRKTIHIEETTEVFLNVNVAQKVPLAPNCATNHESFVGNSGTIVVKVFELQT